MTVTDEFGFQNITTTTITVLKDEAPPNTTHDHDGVWHNGDFMITLMATDYESGVAETYHRINDGAIKAVSVDGQPLITTESANNTLEYWSIDNAGNEEASHKILTSIKLTLHPRLLSTVQLAKTKEVTALLKNRTGCQREQIMKNMKISDLEIFSLICMCVCLHNVRENIILIILKKRVRVYSSQTVLWLFLKAFYAGLNPHTYRLHPSYTRTHFFSNSFHS